MSLITTTVSSIALFVPLIMWALLSICCSNTAEPQPLRTTVGVRANPGVGLKPPFHCWSLLGNMLKITMNYSPNIVYMITNNTNAHKLT